MPNLGEYAETCTKELNEIVKLVRGKLSTQNRTTLGQGGSRVIRTG